MEPFGGYNPSSRASSLLGSVGERNASVRSGFGAQAAESRGKILEAKRRAEEYARTADREASSLRNQGLMQGISGIVSGAMSSFGGGSGLDIGREMSKIGKSGYTLPTSLSGPSGFGIAGSFLN